MARAWSAAFDGLISGYAEQGLGTRISLHAPQVLAAHADFVALGVVLLLTGEFRGLPPGLLRAGAPFALYFSRFLLQCSWRLECASRCCSPGCLRG